MNSANMTPTASQKTTPEGTLSTDAPSEQFLDIRDSALVTWRTQNAVQQHLDNCHSTIGWLVLASFVVWPFIVLVTYLWAKGRL